MIAPSNIGWELLYGIGAALLLLGLIYGVMRTRGSKPDEHARREAKTRALYDAPQASDEEINTRLAQRR